MNIEHEGNQKDGRFLIRQNGKVLAEILYEDHGPGQIAATHTRVDESLKGQGIGRKLLDELVSLARKYNLKIVPVCSFVQAAMEKDDSLRKLRAEM
jgi:uncharacterized protein